MDYPRPKPDYSSPEWWWPGWKFELSVDDLFDTLHTQYNTVPIPILDPSAFHHDVYELCEAATTLSEFHASLARRRDQRLSELRQCWRSSAVRIADKPARLSNPPAQESAERLFAFFHFSRQWSFDALTRYFGLYAYPDSRDAHDGSKEAIGDGGDAGPGAATVEPVTVERATEQPATATEPTTLDDATAPVCPVEKSSPPVDDSRHPREALPRKRTRAQSTGPAMPSERPVKRSSPLDDDDDHQGASSRKKRRRGTAGGDRALTPPDFQNVNHSPGLRPPANWDAVLLTPPGRTSETSFATTTTTSGPDQDSIIPPLQSTQFGTDTRPCG